jgi:hypothetical protein
MLALSVARRAHGGKTATQFFCRHDRSSATLALFRERRAVAGVFTARYWLPRDVPMKQRLVLVLAVALSGISVALAETEEGRQACMQDAFKFCQQAIPDHERVFQCLASHKDVISAACNATMAPGAPVDQRATEQHRSQTKSAAHKAKAPKRASVAVNRPAPRTHAGQTRRATGKIPSAERASLPADHSHLKKHAPHANRAKAKTVLLRRAPNSVARRDGQPLDLLRR